MKKNGKKNFVPAILVGSIGLLLGGLIFLGVSAFPELLEEEKEVTEEKEHLYVLKTDIAINTENGYVSKPGTTNNAAEPANSYDDLQIINISSVKVSNETKTAVISKSYTHDDLFLNKPHKILEDISISGAHTNAQKVEDNFVNEHISYSSYKESSHPVEQVKTKKAVVNKNRSTRSNEAVVETSLLVIGAVDVISMILIKRKKHLFR